MKKDIRVLCFRCISDYREAGYVVYIESFMHEPCDKCGRLGVTCEMKGGGKNRTERQNRNILQRNDKNK